MNIISKVTKTTVGLVFLGSSVFAQSLPDAKKAIDAEQYQKAKSMLKNLTVTQSTKDENYFYLGWVYIKQDYLDSAKASFNKGIAVNNKSALNLAGLGIVARLEKDNSGATNNFNQAIALAGKDTKPYVYIGKGYLLPVTQGGRISAADAEAAIAVLNKGNVAGAAGKKGGSGGAGDPELLIALGDAYRSQLKSNEAYQNYSSALTLDPKSPNANVAIGVLWRYAENFEDSQKAFQTALATDPNFGPAYREWAETDLQWAKTNPAQASAKIKEAAEQYKKYINLTDMSFESRMRYADFLIQAGDYKTLQEVTSELAKSANTNLRAYRYLAYAAYENKDYASGLTAMEKWISQAGNRVIPRDYLYLGRLELASGKDSLGIRDLRKALELDTTQVDVYGEIAKTLYAKKKYNEAGDAYATYISKSRKTTLNDYLALGTSYYFAYTKAFYSTAKPKPVADTMLLVKADSAFSYIQHKTKPIAVVALYQARTNDLKETDRNNIKGLAKPYYDQYLELMAAKTPSDSDKKDMVEAYDYLGAFYEYKAKDSAKATEAYTKAKELDPTDKQAQSYFSRKGGGKSK